MIREFIEQFVEQYRIGRTYGHPPWRSAYLAFRFVKWALDL